MCALVCLPWVAESFYILKKKCIEIYTLHTNVKCPHCLYATFKRKVFPWWLETASTHAVVCDCALFCIISNVQELRIISKGRSNISLYCFTTFSFSQFSEMVYLNSCNWSPSLCFSLNISCLYQTYILYQS